MNQLLLLLISPDRDASARLTEAAADLSHLRIRYSDGEADFWSSLPKTTATALGGVVILAWGMSVDFVRALKSNVASNGIPVVACLPFPNGDDVDTLYEAGASCVVELEGDRIGDGQRLRATLDFWYRSATLPRGWRVAHTT